MISETDILKRIGRAIEEMDLDDLAKLHNETTAFAPITGKDIRLEEGIRELRLKPC